jgi:hypothetical protein
MNIAGGRRWSDRGNPPRWRVRGYLTGALELIRRNALFSDGVDWDAVHQQAQDAVTHACDYAGTYHLLGTVIKQAGGHHSRFIPPAAFRQTRARMAAAGPMLPAGGVTGRIGYLVLPRLPGGQKFAHRYIVVGSGLVDGILGHFALPGGRMQAWSLDRKHVRLDGKREAHRDLTPRADSRRLMPALPQLPALVVEDPTQQASSAGSGSRDGALLGDSSPVMLSAWRLRRGA